jgi:hypothetical protein
MKDVIVAKAFAAVGVKMWADVPWYRKRIYLGLLSLLIIGWPISLIMALSGRIYYKKGDFGMRCSILQNIFVIIAPVGWYLVMISV